MLTFEVIASSSAGCSYRVSGGGSSRPILIDCGVRFEVLQKALDFKVTELAGCLISHIHQDHCKSAVKLASYGVNIYGNAETIKALPSRYAHRMKTFTEGDWTTVGDWQVLPFAAVHDKETFGFVVGSPDGERLLYLTDTCWCPYRFDGLTYLAVEANHSMEIMKARVLDGSLDPDRFARTARNHMSLETLLTMLATNDISDVKNIHLLHLSDSNSDAPAFKLAVERATGIPVTVAGK